jgi:N-methylhydantoinase A
VEAVAVCLLWSIVNPAHELRIAALLDEHLPGVPYTLSHRLNPTLREYRRASSTCIDASLKPMMAAYLTTLSRRLTDSGFTGRTLVVTSQGSVMDSADVAAAPIYLINSGPSMAPVSGKHYSMVDEGTDTVIVADTGGTTYDISLVRRGEIPWTRDSWIGLPYRGHLSGFASVDVTSIGAGGGSIAWVDEGGMLHVGPQSAGSQPGPACYGRGGLLPTVTDASVVLGHLDPDFFLGGTMKLDRDAAVRAVEQHVAQPLSLSLEVAATAILQLATESMVQAILDTSVNQGIDPGSAVLIGGGGAAGLNSVLIARRLGSPRLLIPQVGAALSAAGALISDLLSRFQTMLFARSSAFDFNGVNAALDELEGRCLQFVNRQGDAIDGHTITLWAEARYAEQAWEVPLALPTRRIENADDLKTLVDAFHVAHEALFAIRDEGSEVEIVGWGATVACHVRGATKQLKQKACATSVSTAQRKAYFDGLGYIDVAVHRFEQLEVGRELSGPALIESSFTTVVLHPGATAQRRTSGSLAITPGVA